MGFFARRFGRGPSTADDYCRRAASRVEAERYEEALADLARAIRLDRDKADAYALRAAILHRRGRDKGAIRACEEAIRLDPDCTLAHQTRAAIGQDMGRHAKAPTRSAQSAGKFPSVRLNWCQWIVLCVGVGVLALMRVYPPWEAEVQGYGFHLGYAPYWAPPRFVEKVAPPGEQRIEERLRPGAALLPCLRAALRLTSRAWSWHGLPCPIPRGVRSSRSAMGWSDSEVGPSRIQVHLPLTVGNAWAKIGRADTRAQHPRHLLSATRCSAGSHTALTDAGGHESE